MNLNGSQRQQFIKALLKAFPTKPRLEIMMSVRLDINLETIALGDDLEEIVFKVIRTAEAQGWTTKLLIAARESSPGNPELFAFSQQFGLASTSLSRPELEKVIKATNSFLDVNKWRTRLGEIEAQVCRIEIPLNNGENYVYGTGFLMGPDVVMTNYHVMEDVIENKGAKASDVILRFDYKKLTDNTVYEGTKYHLAKDWLIQKSPPSLVDLTPEPKQDLPSPDQLDYALLRLEGTPGNEPVGGKTEAGAPLRKWVEVQPQTYGFQSNTPLFIIQHPKAEPLKLAFDTDAIIGLNANRTRVTYKTNTEEGSSGSPCFNSNWELVALHHSGEPAYKPTYNEGIPFSAIIVHLDQYGLKGILGEQEM